MILRLFVSFLFFFCLMINAGHAEYTFNEWDLKQAQQYAEELENNFKTLTDEDIKRSATRAADALKKKAWSVVVLEREQIAGKNKNSAEAWLDLALACYNNAQHQKDKKWEFLSKSGNAALYAYKIAKKPDEKARALLVYSQAKELSPHDTITALHEVDVLFNLKELRQKYPDYAPLAAFTYNKFTINNNSVPPSICFSFTQPLGRNLNLSDFIEVTPKVDGNFQVKEHEACLGGLVWGQQYDAILKEGLPSILGEKTAQTSKVSFSVQDQTARLSFNSNTYILRQDEVQHLPLTAVNVSKVRIKIIRVNDRNLQRFQEGSLYGHEIEHLEQDTGELIYKGTMTIGGDKNKTTTQQIPLKEAIPVLKPGVYGVFVEEEGSLTTPATASQWLLITDLGMSTYKGENGLWTNVRSLATAKPLEKVEIQLLAYNNKILAAAKTDKEGFVLFDASLLRGKGGDRPAVVLAYSGDQHFGLLKLNEPAFDLSDRGVEGRKAPGPLDAFLYMERGVYRPGETVRVNTLLRNDKAIAQPNVQLTFKVLRPNGSESETHTVKGDEQGFYDLTFPLAAASRIGQWTVMAYADPKQPPIGQTTFAVEDFVPSRLSVTLQTDQKVLSPEKPITLEVSARYLFGSAASGLQGQAYMDIERRPNPFPTYKDYQFGKIDEEPKRNRIPLTLPVLDKEGKATVPLQLKGELTETIPLEALVVVEIFESGGRPQKGILKLPIQQYPFMIGLKSAANPTGIIEFDSTTTTIDVITVDGDGNLIDVPELEYSLYAEELHYDWYQDSPGSTSWQFKPIRDDKFIQSGTLKTESDKPTPLTIPTKDWDLYRLEVKSPKTGATTSYRLQKGYSTSDRDTQTPDRLKVTHDKEIYQSGEAVRIHIEPPFDGEALIVIANESMVETKNVPVSKKGTDIQLKANDAWGTGAYILVSAFRPLAGESKMSDVQKATLPKRAIGLSWVSIAPASRTLAVGMTLPPEIQPRQKLEVPLKIEGNTSTKTFVTIAAVDEGILQLTDFKTPKPESYFLDKRQLGVELRDIYGKIINPISGQVGILRSGGDGYGGMMRNLPTLSKRSFQIISLFQGPVALDDKGVAIVSLDIPDFNGTLRLMGIAYNQTSIGSGDAQLLVRDPVVAEGVLPRFLTLDDSSQLSLSLFNNTGKEGTYQVELSAEGGLSLTGDPLLKTTLAIGGVWHGTVPLKAAQLGDGKITVKLTGDNTPEITRVFELTVRAASTSLSKTTVQLLKPKETMTLNKQGVDDLIQGTEAITLTVSNRIPWDMSQILRALKEYPYGCVEQNVSRGFGFLFTPLLGTETQEETQAREKAIHALIADLSEKQSKEGWFSLWRQNDPEDPWLTAYALDFMQRAENLKIPIPKYTYENGLDWLLRSVKSHSSSNTEEQHFQAAYGLYILSKTSKIEPGAIRYFFDTYYDLIQDPIGRAFVGAALARIGDIQRAERAFANLFKVKKQKVKVYSQYGSEIRDQSIILLLALETLKLAPTLTSLATLAETTIANLNQAIQTQANRLGTQEMAWLVLASQTLSSEKEGDAKAKGINLKVNTEDHKGTNLFHFPLSPVDLRQGIPLTNEGESNLWVNALITGIPQKPQPPEEKGIQATCRYYTLDGQEVDLSQPDRVLTQGEQLIVVIEGSVDEAQLTAYTRQLLIVDLLPACFEVDSTHPVAPQTGEKKLPWSDTTESQYAEGRDDRFVASLQVQQASPKFKVAYSVRVITPGTYLRPGLSVEDMFRPTVFARLGENRIRVVKK